MSKHEKNVKLRVQKAPQAPLDLDHRIRLEKLCSLKKQNTSIGPPSTKLSHFKDFDLFQTISQAPVALKRTVSLISTYYKRDLSSHIPAQMKHTFSASPQNHIILSSSHSTPIT